MGCEGCSFYKTAEFSANVALRARVAVTQGQSVADPSLSVSMQCFGPDCHVNVVAITGGSVEINVPAGGRTDLSTIGYVYPDPNDAKIILDVRGECPNPVGEIIDVEPR